MGFFFIAFFFLYCCRSKASVKKYWIENSVPILYNNTRIKSKEKDGEQTVKSMSSKDTPNTDNEQINEVVLRYLKRNFLFTAIVNYDDDNCYPVSVNDKALKPLKSDISIKQLLERSKKIVHPLFVQRFEEIFSPEVLERAYADDKLLTQELMLKNGTDKQYQWYMIRLTPVKTEDHKRIFFYTCILTDSMIKQREKEKDESFNMSVLKQLIYDQVLVYVIDLDNGMSKLVHSRENDEFDTYANKFKDHKDMMDHLRENFVSDDFKKDFARYSDYEYIEKQFAAGKDRLVYVFRDISGRAFELNASKYHDYSETYKLIIFSIKELS